MSIYYVVNGQKVDPKGNPIGSKATSPARGGSKGGDPIVVPEDATVAVLEGLVKKAGLTVTGTGAEGRVLKPDLEKAIEDYNASLEK
jgi:hypothetical protein